VTTTEISAAVEREAPATHTPGPWNVGVQHLSLFIVAGRAPSSVDVEAWHDAPRVAVAKVMRPSSEDALPIHEEANARLLAAAPEMYQALLAMVILAKSGAEPVSVLAQAEAAIAKAEGRS
jgi:hypothetical protein